MAMNEQIGESQEAKLLHAISKQLDILWGLLSKVVSGGGGSSDVWTEDKWQDAYDLYKRPADWLPLPAVNLGEEKIVLLHAVFDHDSNFTALNVTGSNGYTVDWGDGVVQNFASGVQANHLYDFNYAGFAATLTSRGYKQAIVIITPQAGGNLLTVDFNLKHNLIASTYAAGWLDCRAAGINFTSFLFNGVTALINVSYLEMFEFIGTNNITDTSNMFSGCYSLVKVVSLNTSKVTNTNKMLSACYSLLTIPLLDTRLVTTATQMFNGCYAMTIIPLIDLGNLIDGTSMFSGSPTLKYIPLLDLHSLQNGTSMFSFCHSIISHPFYNLSSLTNGTSMFQNNEAVTQYPLYNLGALTIGTSMFSFNYSLANLPLFNLSALTNATSMFQNNPALQTIPLFNFGNVTNGTSLFQDSRCIQTVPLFDFHSLTNSSNMFYFCYGIASIPLFNLSALTIATQMFLTTPRVRKFPTFNWTSVITSGSVFFNDYSLEEFPPLDTSNATTTNSFMANNYSMRGVFPQLNLLKVTNTQGIYSNSYVAKKFPPINVPLATVVTSVISSSYSVHTAPVVTMAGVAVNATSMFSSDRSLQIVPAMSFNPISTTTNMYSGTASLSRIMAYGQKVSFDVSPCRLSKIALEEIFSNVQANTAQTITITGNWGSVGIYAPVSKVTTGTTVGSATLTQANTSSLAIGMLVTGTGISDAKAVSFVTGTNLVTRATHGIPNGRLVYFATIVTTTGIVIRTPYYVVNANVNDFQVSLTNGGSPLTLTTNGTGTVTYPSFITAINTNVNYTIDIPATAAGSITTTNRLLNTSLAQLKGWTITG